MLEVGRLKNFSESRTHFGAWAIMSSPLILSFDIRVNKDLDEMWPVITNRDVIAVNQRFLLGAARDTQYKVAWPVTFRELCVSDPQVGRAPRHTTFVLRGGQRKCGELVPNLGQAAWSTFVRGSLHVRRARNTVRDTCVAHVISHGRASLRGVTFYQLMWCERQRTTCPESIDVARLRW